MLFINLNQRSRFVLGLCCSQVAKINKGNFIMNAFHAHDILNLLIESDTPYTLATLKTEVADKFGADATFYTCKLKDLSIEQLLQFFVEKNKVTINDDIVTANIANMCHH